MSGDLGQSWVFIALWNTFFQDIHKLTNLQLQKNIKVNTTIIEFSFKAWNAICPHRTSRSLDRKNIVALYLAKADEKIQSFCCCCRFLEKSPFLNQAIWSLNNPVTEFKHLKRILRIHSFPWIMKLNRVVLTRLLQTVKYYLLTYLLPCQIMREYENTRNDTPAMILPIPDLEVTIALITLDCMHKNVDNYSYAHILSRKLQLCAYFVAKITITRFGGQVQLTKYNGGQVRGL